MESVKSYAVRIGADYQRLTEPKLKIAPLHSCRSENALRHSFLPVYEKENAFALLGEYDQVAIVDADIYARASAPNIFDALGDADFGAVLERDLPLTDQYLEKIRKHSDGQFSSLNDVDWDWNADGAAYYNMGLMLFSRKLAEYLNGQTPGEFLRRPEFERFVNGAGHWKWSTDQTLLNWWVKKTGMPTVNLDWRWNALYGAILPDRIEQAWFVHFFLSAKLPRRGAEIPQIISKL